jgi:type I restriction enzyme, S subunit
MPEQAFGRVTLESVTTGIKDGTHGTHARAADGVPFLSAKNITESGTLG